ncbi:bifunctional RNase H/acid phosphatase [Corynebacterium sp. HMSC074A01]|uniref:bifunctional RNase H/acid phosphatase n=1 Tax=Corynebacterium sp. HMSC074A01 TaxID=1715030 RepID=UPI0008A5B65B|nr:bifunctional RNase H/acid phosphatase [Corynebacterium sp. HMSC074A01]OHF36106.1 bifunctional RNase H/acid phosphatase [Corynebacterium sp. HMSC074A01]
MKVAVFTDGGSRGNPGVAGSGAVLYDESGATLAEIVYVVGAKSSNNVAEYHGLLRGLEAAAELGATEVAVSMDSKLVVEQMNGRWKIKHPDMQKLAMQARKLAGSFERVTYTWVPRAKNKKADELSNLAMDAAEKDGTPRIVETGSAAAAKKAEAPHAAALVHGATDTPRTRFILLRHGQTEHSAEHRLSGVSNPELTELGREQARRAAEALRSFGPIDAIVASPQTRAQQTAQAAADALGFDSFETVDGFREINFGDFEGLTRKEAQEKDGEAFGAWEASISKAPPNGESITALHRRVTRARLKLQEQREGQTILVVTHMMPIKSVIRQGLGSGAEVFTHSFLDLASISVVDFWADFGVVRCVNDVAHHR